MKISMTNSKLGSIPSINLPVSICRADAPCRGKGCYACKGTWLYPNVQNSLNSNLADFVTNPCKFFADIVAYLNDKLVTYKYFRWFGSGDIVNNRFLAGMIEVAKACPQTRFLAFTKKYELVNEYLYGIKELPDNLNIIFSSWDKDFVFDNPHNLPVAYIDFKDKTRNLDIPMTAKHCTGKCTNCQKCWYLPKGDAVVFNQH